MSILGLLEKKRKFPPFDSHLVRVGDRTLIIMFRRPWSVESSPNFAAVLQNDFRKLLPAGTWLWCVFFFILAYRIKAVRVNPKSLPIRTTLFTRLMNSVWISPQRSRSFQLPLWHLYLSNQFSQILTKHLTN